MGERLYKFSVQVIMIVDEKEVPCLMECEARNPQQARMMANTQWHYPHKVGNLFHGWPLEEE